jgi:S1-C subfamily serine protease
MSRFGATLSALVLLTSATWARTALAALPLQDLVEQTKPSVVYLVVADENGEVLTSGSGFFVSRTGAVATNFHVVDGARKMLAVLEGGKKVEVIGVHAFDPEADVAVLQLAKGEYPELRLASRGVKAGDPVVVIGSPQGLTGSVSTGVVSAIRDDGVGDGDDRSSRRWAIQISAPTSPGSSGSPVLNEDGEVLGLAVGTRLGGQALNFAVPVRELESLLSRPRGALLPLDQVRSGRTTRENLVISGAGLAGVCLVAWVATAVLRRRRRTPAGIAERLVS